MGDSANLDTLFDDYIPDPSLLHGDLWGGNWSAVDGQPVIFDPAVYYGDRETEQREVASQYDAEIDMPNSASWPLEDYVSEQDTTDFTRCPRCGSMTAIDGCDNPMCLYNRVENSLDDDDFDDE